MNPAFRLLLVLVALLNVIAAVWYVASTMSDPLFRAAFLLAFSVLILFVAGALASPSTPTKR